MGNWFSTPNSETKMVDTDGEVNNNVVIQGATIDYGFEIMVLTSIICALKIFELVIYVYKRHTKFVQRKFERKSGIDKV